MMSEVLSYRHASRRPTPILHSFIHALSSILAYLRQNAETIPPDLLATGADACLTALWTRYEDTEHILRALAALCGRVSRPFHPAVIESHVTTRGSISTPLHSCLFHRRQHLSYHSSTSTWKTISSAHLGESLRESLRIC